MVKITKYCRQSLVNGSGKKIISHWVKTNPNKDGILKLEEGVLWHIDPVVNNVKLKMLWDLECNILGW